MGRAIRFGLLAALAVGLIAVLAPDSNLRTGRSASRPGSVAVVELAPVVTRARGLDASFVTSSSPDESPSGEAPAVRMETAGPAGDPLRPLRGRVVWADEVPAGRARVRLLELTESSSGPRDPAAACASLPVECRVAFQRGLMENYTIAELGSAVSSLDGRFRIDPTRARSSSAEGYIVVAAAELGPSSAIGWQHLGKDDPKGDEPCDTIPLDFTLTRVRVRAFTGGGASVAGARVEMQSSEWTLVLTTDAAGVVEDWMPESKLWLHVEREGLAAEEIVMDLAGPAVELAIPLDPEATVEGEVRSIDGRPVSGAVEVYQIYDDVAPDGRIEQRWFSRDDCPIDGSGHYRVRGLSPARACELDVKPDDRGLVRAARLFARPPTTADPIVLERGGCLAVMATADGTPITSACTFQLERLEARGWRCRETATAVVASFSQLEPGSYRVWATVRGRAAGCSGVVIVEGGTGADVEVPLPRGRTISGRVVAMDGSPASVRLTLEGDPFGRGIGLHRDGSFMLEDVTEEEVTIVIDDPPRLRVRVPRDVDTIPPITLPR